MNKKLSVRLYGKPVGILEQDLSGNMNFRYLSDAVGSLSLSLPLREEPYPDLACKAYFGGLLPESETIRKAIGKRFNINHKNDFSLLQVIGYDCAGAVSFHKIDAPITETEFVELQGYHISESELADHINSLPSAPLFLGFKDLRLSLAGVQDKAAISIIDNKISIPKDGSPTTHVLKPAVSGFEEIIENEYLCMKTALKLGFDVPDVQIRQAKGIKYLLIERYDRVIKQHNLIKRIHQEDFCQALGIVSAYKYQSEGGPGFKECFDLLKMIAYPAIARNKLAERAVFNFLTGNTDAHGKNFSLLHSDKGIVLSPVYDVLCSQVYPSLSNKMAMKIGGYYEFSKVFPRHWEKFCQQIGYSYPQIKKIIIKQAETLPKVLEEEVERMKEDKLPCSTAKKILSIVEKNCDVTLKSFGNKD